MPAKQQYLKKLTHFFDEQSNSYIPVIDRIKEFKKIGKQSSARSFIKNRHEKRRLLRKDEALLRKTKKKLPVPGGVGYGVYFKKPYYQDFTNFACLDFGILVPGIAGGNSDNFLYLTATNGTAKGVEALVSYTAQEAPEFKIYDWAKGEPQRWSYSVPLAGLQQNLSTVTVNGLEHRCCRVLNHTERLGADLWENKVCLFNYSLAQWDLIYSFQYTSTLAAQKSDFNGSWGPIVETFSTTPFTDLNAMGFFNIMLYNDAKQPKLVPGNSVIHDDNDGIDVVFIEPNTTFYVT